MCNNFNLKHILNKFCTCKYIIIFIALLCVGFTSTKLYAQSSPATNSVPIPNSNVISSPTSHVPATTTQDALSLSDTTGQTAKIDQSDQGMQSLGILPIPNNKTSDEIPPEVKILKSIETEIRDKYKTQVYERSQIPSLFFTPPQYALLREARIGFNSRIPTLQDLRDPTNPTEKGVKTVDIVRRLSLSGILYVNDEDWNIYFNNRRITPKNIPEDIVEIKVTGNYVDMVWYDQLSNMPVTLRLRPGQIFDLDQKTFVSNYVKIKSPQNGLDQGTKDDIQ